MKDFEPKKILIIRLSAVGDTIHTIPLVNSIKKSWQNCEIHWIVEDKASFFVSKLKNVDKCIILPKNKWKKEKNIVTILKEFFEIITQLKKEKYDIAIDVQSLFKSGVILGLCGAKRKISSTHAREFAQIFATEILQMKSTLFDSNVHILDIYNQFVEYLKIEKQEPEFLIDNPSDESMKYISELTSSLNPNLPCFIFAPATTWHNKHIHISIWKKLVELYSDKANIIFTGMSNDNILIKEIIQNYKSENIYNFCGKTNLEQLYVLLKKSDLVISPDSGTAHIAWACEHPYLITIFTSTAKNRTGPVGKNCISLSGDLSCQPCLKKKCKLKHNKNICMNSVNLSEIEEIINKKFFLK